MYAYVIAGIVLITIFLWMSNSIRNQPIVKSASVRGFIEKFMHRHMIAIPLIITMLFIIPFLTGPIGVALDAVFIAAEVFRDYKIIVRCRQRQAYIKSITPNERAYYARIHLNDHDNQRLGGHKMRYMFICPKTQLITFPESKYGNSRKYRLIHVKFKPKYGPDYLRLTYSGKAYTRKSLFDKQANHNVPKIHGNQITEIPNVAHVTLQPVGFSQRIHIRLLAEISRNVKSLEDHCISNLHSHLNSSNLA